METTYVFRRAYNTLEHFSTTSCEGERDVAKEKYNVGDICNRLMLCYTITFL